MPEPSWYAASLVVTLIASFAAHWWIATRQAADWQSRLVPFLSLAMGLAVAGLSPRWPPSSALDRLLILAIPATLVWELLFASGRRLARWEPVARGFGAFACCFTVLYGSVYLRPDTPEGAAAVGWWVMAVGGPWLAAEWSTVSTWIRRTNDPVMVLALGLTILATGLTILLAGYVRGGAVAIPLGAAIGASAFVRATSSSAAATLESAASLGVLGLAGLLLIGRFFGGVTTAQASLLMIAPLFACLPLPRLVTSSPRLHQACRLAVVAIPLAIVLAFAFQVFQRKFQSLL